MGDEKRLSRGACNEAEEELMAFWPGPRPEAVLIGAAWQIDRWTTAAQRVPVR